VAWVQSEICPNTEDSVMDEIDRANDLAQMHLDAAIKAARGVMPPDMRSAETCEDCGAAISSARQIAVPGCTMCTDCATKFEGRRLRGLV
jgi:phage/conjugal plasmid C-4 type zinc finger TraR family protein